MIAVYCICPKCIQCGCGLWEKHHDNLSELTYPDAVYKAMDAEVKRKRRGHG